jgi:site-specific recombinase XerD
MSGRFEAFSQALVAEGKSDLTVKHYLSDLRQFASWFEGSTGGTFAPVALTGLDMVSYRSYLMTIKNYQPATINRNLASLSKFCRWARGQGLIEENPVAEVKGVKETQPTAPKALARREWLRFLRTVHSGHNKRDIALVELMGNTGLPTREAAALRLEDIQTSPRKGRVTVRGGKGIKYRAVPLNADVRRAISDYLEVRPGVADEHLFIGQRGNGLTPAGIRRIIKKYGQQAGLDIHPYVLRHTYATRLLREEGVDLVTVQATLGHESPATTAKYTKPSEEEQQAALEKLAIRE